LGTSLFCAPKPGQSKVNTCVTAALCGFRFAGSATRDESAAAHGSSGGFGELLEPEVSGGR